MFGADYGTCTMKDNGRLRNGMEIQTYIIPQHQCSWTAVTLARCEDQEQSCTAYGEAVRGGNCIFKRTDSSWAS